jgi:hypothetical protein
MLYLICLFITSNVEYQDYRDTVENILSQIVAISSVKYSLVLLRSFLFKLGEQKFSKFIVLSHLYLYAPLLFDPTLEDIKTLYLEFNQLSNEILRN